MVYNSFNMLLNSICQCFVKDFFVYIYGNPLQCSCLENPRDGGAWWAAVYGVTQSRTRLKQLSSSSIEWEMYLPLVFSVVKSESERHSVVSNSLWPHELYRNSPGQNTGVGSFSLLQGILPTQGSNLGLPHCRSILYQLSYKGSPRILEWVAYPFSSRSSQPRNQTRVSCIAGRFFTNWDIREAL